MFDPGVHYLLDANKLSPENVPGVGNSFLQMTLDRIDTSIQALFNFELLTHRGQHSEEGCEKPKQGDGQFRRDVHRRFSCGEMLGVAGGVRTLGHWNHNPALYQLSYSHRNITVYQCCSTQEIGHRVNDRCVREID